MKGLTGHQIKMAGIRKKYGLTSEEIAKMFGYKNKHSFQTAARRSEIEKGIIEVIKTVEELEDHN